jgi:hypothetical protein
MEFNIGDKGLTRCGFAYEVVADIGHGDEPLIVRVRGSDRECQRNGEHNISGEAHPLDLDTITLIDVTLTL